MIASLIFVAALAAAPSADDPERQENYETMLSCAAFHTIEATRSDGGAVESQQAVAYDFAKSAVAFAPDKSVESTNADLGKLLGVFREKLDTGDVREMAEDWTDLGSACRRLYPVRDEVGKTETETTESQ